MTQHPMPPQPVGYYQPAPSPRPTSVTVLGIIGIILGALGLICTPFAILPLFMDTAQSDFERAMWASPLFRTWAAISSVLWLLVSGLLLASAIGSLMLKPWARQGMIWYAGVAIVLAAIGLAISAVTLAPLAGQPHDDAVERAASIGGIAGGICGGAVAMIYPIFVLIFMRRPHVIAAFEDPQQSQQWPYQPPQYPQPGR